MQAYAPRLTVDVNEHIQGSEMTGHTGTEADSPDFGPGSGLSHKHAQARPAPQPALLVACRPQGAPAPGLPACLLLLLLLPGSRPELRGPPP